VAGFEAPGDSLATPEEAEAARQRLISRFPGSEEVWMIHRDITAQEFPKVFDAAEVEEE
jgi:hypothetical protein